MYKNGGAMGRGISKRNQEVKREVEVRGWGALRGCNSGK
jgi:hypothetical protein